MNPTRRIPFLAALLVAACASRAPAPAPASPSSPDPFRDLLITEGACRQVTPQVLRRSDVLRDLDVLERILARGYAGWDAAAQAGADWRASLQQLRRVIAGSPELLPAETVRAIVVQHLSFTRDRHLGIWLMDEEGRVDWMSCGAHQDAYTTDVVVTRDAQRLLVRASSVADVPVGAALRTCDGGDVKPLLHRTVVGESLEGGYLLLKLQSSAPSPLRCTFDVDGRAREVTLPFHRLRSTSTEPRQGLPPVDRHNGNVTRLRVRTFDTAAASVALSTFVATAKEVRDEPALILDVRGNSGGGDGPISDWFAALSNTTYKARTVEKLVSEVTAQGAINTTRCDLLRADEGSRDELTAMLQRSQGALDAMATQAPPRTWETYNPERRGEAPSSFQGALVVLTDARCASSCEATVRHARQLGRTLIVGENTSGTGTFGELFMYRLPRTGLGLSVPSKWFHGSSDDAAFEGRGHLPDIWLDTEDAANVAERLAVCLTDVACGARLEAFAAHATHAFVARAR